MPRFRTKEMVFGKFCCWFNLDYIRFVSLNSTKCFKNSLFVVFNSNLNFFRAVQENNGSCLVHEPPLFWIIRTWYNLGEIMFVQKSIYITWDKEWKTKANTIQVYLDEIILQDPCWSSTWNQKLNFNLKKKKQNEKSLTIKKLKFHYSENPKWSVGSFYCRLAVFCDHCCPLLVITNTTELFFIHIIPTLNGIKQRYYGQLLWYNVFLLGIMRNNFKW